MDVSLTIGSLIAIAILAWIASRLFPTTVLLDRSRAERNLRRFAPEARIEDILVSEDGLAAIAILDASSHEFGLLRQLGDRVVCRVMTQADIAKIYWNHAGVTIASTDFTQPEVTLVLNDKSRKQAENLFSTIMHVPEGAHAA